MAGYPWQFTLLPETINEITVTQTSTSNSVVLQRQDIGPTESGFTTSNFTETSTVTISAIGYNDLTNVTVGDTDLVMTKAFTIIDVITDNDGKVLMLNNKALIYVLPNEYTKVDYIASTGTQYIDTNVIPRSNNLIYEWEGRDDTPSGNTSLFASEHYITGSSSVRDFSGVLYGNNTKRNIYVGRTTGMTVGYSSTDGLFHKWSLNISSDHKLFLTKDGTKLTVYNWTGDINKYNTIFLYCNHVTSGPSQYAKVAYRYFKIRDEAGLLFYGIPARRNSDQVLGMYDLVTKQFFTNGGTGTFVADNNYLTFGTTNANIVERCNYESINGGIGVVVNATSTYGRASFTFPVVSNGTQYKIEFDAEAEGGYKMIYFHNAAFNPGDGWDPVYGTMSVAAGGHFTKTITSSSNILWIGIYASATTTTGKITLKNVTVTPIA